MAEQDTRNSTNNSADDDDNDDDELAEVAADWTKFSTFMEERFGRETFQEGYEHVKKREQ